MIILDITKTVSNNCFKFILHWMQKPRSHISSSSLTASNMNRAKLTWLPSEIMLCGHTWHNYPWPWVSLTWLSYNLQLWHHRHWFRKFTVGFWPIRKELEFNVYSFLIRLHCSWIFVKPFSSKHYQTSYLGVISQSEILTIIVNSTILILKLCSISN